MIKVFKVFSILFLVAFATSCGPKKNQIIFDDAANQDILYGVITVEAFANQPFNDWYTNEYNSYIPQKEFVDLLNPLIDSITVTLVMGTWCSDSKREVPRFVKLLDSLNFSNEQLKIIGVNRSKVCPECGVEEGYVDFVPTFIISRNNIEIGRIIESPTLSLEEDFYQIVK